MHLSIVWTKMCLIFSSLGICLNGPEITTKYRMIYKNEFLMVVLVKYILLENIKIWVQHPFNTEKVSLLRFLWLILKNARKKLEDKKDKLSNQKSTKLTEKWVPYGRFSKIYYFEENQDLSTTPLYYAKSLQSCLFNEKVDCEISLEDADAILKQEIQEYNKRLQFNLEFHRIIFAVLRFIIELWYFISP